MALSSFRFSRKASDSADRSQARTLYNAGTLFSSWRRYAKALECYEGALEADPGHASALYGKGCTLLALHREAEALSCFERALQLQPEFPDALGGRASALAALNRDLEAITCWEQLLALEPDRVDANFGRGISLLTMGNLPGGFRGFEYRDRLPGAKKNAPRLATPRWSGEESLAGKRILLYPDGGLGDGIQMARYVPLLAERGARVILRVPDKLCSLFGGIPSVDRVIADYARIPAHDFHGSMMSLPLLLGTTIDTIPGPCLRADGRRVEAWAQRMGPRRRPRIGIAWAGNKRHRLYNERRSIALEVLRPLGELDCELISLQRPVPRDDREALRAMPWLNRLGETLEDFSEIAAAIENLDLVIGVDSAIAHLAASLGKPTWVLLCHRPDWRWQTVGTDSPWYPAARLFRQTTPGDWPGVIAEVKTAWVQAQSAGAEEPSELCPAARPK